MAHMLDESKLLSVVEEGLDRLEEELGRPKPDLTRVARTLPPWLSLTHLPPDLRQRAEALYLRLWQTSGTSKHMVEERLLTMLREEADPASLPFWREVVGLDRARDTFSTKRRELAVAAVARTAERHPGSDAREVLRAFTGHEHPKVRGYAVEALAGISTGEDGVIAPAVMEVLRRVAASDPALEPGFIARRLLAEQGTLLRVLAEDDVVAFQVQFGGASRTIEVSATQTLADLHSAILRSLGWDFDHLHAFYLTGNQRDRRFTIPDEGGLDDTELPLGAIGFPAGHRFVYHYDFGDNNFFEVLVLGTDKAAPGAKYPRIIAQRGKSPPQYRGV